VVDGTAEMSVGNLDFLLDLARDVKKVDQSDLNLDVAMVALSADQMGWMMVIL